MKTNYGSQTIKKLNSYLNLNYPKINFEYLSGRGENTDDCITIKKQNGVSFELHFYLDDDELHINAGKYFWVEWFPTTDILKCENYLKYSKGLINGECRIIETLKNNKVFRADLQEKTKFEWENVATYFNGFVIIKRNITYNILHNKKQD